MTEKYGVIVQVTKEILEVLISPKVLENNHKLAELMKIIILTNWNLLHAKDLISCEVHYDFEKETYSIKLRSVSAIAPLQKVEEGCSFPHVSLNYGVGY